MTDYVNQANACVARAEKALKTGMLKWTPDYEIAANEYVKAAVAFRSAKLTDKFIEAHLNAAKCFESTRSFFQAGKSFEQIAQAARDKNDYATMITYYEKACVLFREYGVPDTAALTYNKAAGMLETIRPEKSAEWYGHASETVLLEDRYLQAAEYANKAVRMYLKLKDYDHAIEWSMRAFENYNLASENRSAGRQVCQLVIIHLARDDSVAAEKVYLANKGLVENDERYVLENLFQGIDQFDNVAICSALKTPFIQNLENEVTKIIRDLLVKYQPKKGGGGGGGGNGGGNAAGGSSAAAGDDDDDESGAML